MPNAGQLLKDKSHKKHTCALGALLATVVYMHVRAFVNVGLSSILLLGACGGDAPPRPSGRLVSLDPSLQPITSAPKPATPAPPTPTPNPALNLNPPGVHVLDPVLPTRAPSAEPDYSTRCVWTRGPESRKVGLAFDVPAKADGVLALLDALASQGVRATFFVSASFATSSPAAYQQMVKDNHEIGLHSLEHTRLSVQATSLMLADFRENARSLISVAGRPPIQVVRLPFGDGIDVPRVTEALCSNGYRIAHWEIDDPDLQEGYDAAALSREVLAQTVTGGRILYIKATSNARALPNVIGLLAERNLIPTTVTDAMGLPQPLGPRAIWPRPTPLPSNNPSTTPTLLPSPSRSPLPTRTP